MADGLDTYEIEENFVKLTFKDGSSRLVSIDNLADHLEGRDLARVKRAVTLRQNFIKSILPPWAKVVVIGVGAFTLMLNLNMVAGLFGLKPAEVPAKQDQSVPLEGGTDSPRAFIKSPSDDAVTDAINSKSQTSSPVEHTPQVRQPQTTLPVTASPTATEAVTGQAPISPKASDQARAARQSNPSTDRPASPHVSNK